MHCVFKLSPNVKDDKKKLQKSLPLADSPALVMGTCVFV